VQTRHGTVARAALAIAIAGAVCISIAGTVLGGGTTAAFASLAHVTAEHTARATRATQTATPTAGAIVVYSPQKDSIHGTVTITGAIGDYGVSTAVNKAGKAVASGWYVKLQLKKGSFEVNTSAFNAQARKVQPTINDATCSASASATGPATIFNGTGLYQGITGTLTITALFGIVSPTAKSGKGQCNGNAKPLSQYMVITGSGSVSFG